MNDKDIEKAIDMVLDETQVAEPSVKPTTAPTQTPVRRKRTSRPSTPIRPTPGVSPKPKAQKVSNDVELFKRVRL